MNLSQFKTSMRLRAQRNDHWSFMTGEGSTCFYEEHDGSWPRTRWCSTDRCFQTAGQTGRRSGFSFRWEQFVSLMLRVSSASQVHVLGLEGPGQQSILVMLLCLLYVQCMDFLQFFDMRCSNCLFCALILWLSWNSWQGDNFILVWCISIFIVTQILWVEPGVCDRWLFLKFLLPCLEWVGWSTVLWISCVCCADCLLCSGKVSGGGVKSSSFNTNTLIKHLKMKDEAQFKEFAAAHHNQRTLQQLLQKHEEMTPGHNWSS